MTKLFQGQKEILHGADYNPEQWLDYPDTLTEDLALMKEAHINVVSLGMFSWSHLEPEEGHYNFTFFDELIEKLSQEDISFFLATPSGARPVWLAKKYPSVLRTDEKRVKQLFGLRHNHCFTSPDYRRQVQKINHELAKRYGNHPKLLGWHVSNEYGGDCHCQLCQESFRKWLQEKYGTIDNLNKAWWTSFWSHTYQTWEDIDSPSSIGESMLHGLNLDWKRFVSHQTIDFYQNECVPLRLISPNKPITTNFMELFSELDYGKFAPHVDFISWDSYPTWHDLQDPLKLASYTAFNHDWFRSFKKDRPFILMESTPSSTNWQAVSKLKEPKMHELSSIQAIAHGADSVQYFQWRKSRGASEKLHGAVVSHHGGKHTRVFKEVSTLGKKLKELSGVVGTIKKATVAIIFDTENRWAVNDSQGPRNIGVHYEQTVISYYHSLWKKGIAVDIISQESELSDYQLVIAPMLYLLKEKTAENIESFVESGGTLLVSYWTGIVDENDLCYLTETPYRLTEVLGIEVEEIDGLHDTQTRLVKGCNKSALKIIGEFKASELCEIIHVKGAEVLAVYGDGFYQGKPVLTHHNYGKGDSYYLSCRVEEELLDQVLNKICQKHTIFNSVVEQLPSGISISTRQSGEESFNFIMNFNDSESEVLLAKDNYYELVTGEIITDKIKLEPYGFCVLKSESGHN